MQHLGLSTFPQIATTRGRKGTPNDRKGTLGLGEFRSWMGFFLAGLFRRRYISPSAEFARAGSVPRRCVAFREILPSKHSKMPQQLS